MEERMISDMSKLGCNNKTDALLTYQVYIDLIEIKKFYDISFHYSEALGSMYITAKDTQNGLLNSYVPISSLNSISFNKMEQMLEISNNERKSIYLVLVASDSTCVYYQISDGILPISEINPGGPKFEKRQKRDKDLIKRKEDIRRAAFLQKSLDS